MPLPAVALMHPTLIHRPIHHEGWSYEEKVDGWRMVAYKDGAKVRLVTEAADPGNQETSQTP